MAGVLTAPVTAVLAAPVTAVLTAPVTTVLTFLVVTTVTAVMPRRDGDSNRITSAIGDAGDWFFDTVDEHPYLMLALAGVCILVPLALFFGVTLGVALSYLFDSD